MVRSSMTMRGNRSGLGGMVDFLSQYCLVEDKKKTFYRRVFDQVDQEKKNWLDKDELALGMAYLKPPGCVGLIFTKRSS